MATIEDLDASPVKVLRSMRGSITDARQAYPEVLHLQTRDSRGDIWRLATQDAEWSPSNPTMLLGKSIEEVDIDETSGELRLSLSDGTLLEIRPAQREGEDDLPSWELITPSGLALEFGPGLRWQISSADAPARSER